MKNLKFSLGLKAAAFVLLFVFAVGTLGGIVFFIHMVDYGTLYGDDYTKTQRYEDLLLSDGIGLVQYCGEQLPLSELPPFRLREADRPERTSLRFAVFAGDRLLYTNVESAGPDLTPGEAGALMSAGSDTSSAQPSGNSSVFIRYFSDDTADYTVYLSTILGEGRDDPYRSLYDEFYLIVRLRPLVLSLLPVFFLISLALFTYLTASTGFRRGVEQPVLYAIDRIYTDLFLVIVGLLVLLPLLLMAEISSEFSQYAELAAAIPAAFLAYALLMESYLSIVRRIRNGVLLKNSILYKVGRFTRDFFTNLPAVLKTTALLILVYIVNLIGVLAGFMGGSVLAVLFVFMTDVLVYVFILYAVIGFDRVRKTAQMISLGDVSCKVDTRSLMGDVLKLARTVNNIGDGLERSVELQMKSERMKTDLIANVSHDLRTPLTSILSYADLIRKQPDLPERVPEYADVLSAKAQQLRQLTEDLIDASKTSSGSVQINFEPLNLSELINQALGEYADRLNERGLSVVCSLPEQPAVIHADGRHIWRVAENLLSNCCKYAQPGSRVYVDVTAAEDRIVFMMKNISENALNISAEELMERFVRGDASRNTEGSGLGLSIARDLVRLQGGTFDITVDGDLFKVTITFTQIPQ